MTRKNYAGIPYEEFMKQMPKSYEETKEWQPDLFEDDMVNHPPHYNQAGIECIDAIRAATDGGYEYYLQGNILKYLWRYRYKNGVEDLEKAEFYLQSLLEHKKGEDL